MSLNTRMPRTTRPNATRLPSSQGMGHNVTKNWELLVWGASLLAMLCNS
jgi:hypothetical protein